MVGMGAQRAGALWPRDSRNLAPAAQAAAVRPAASARRQPGEGAAKGQPINLAIAPFGHSLQGSRHAREAQRKSIIWPAFLSWPLKRPRTTTRVLKNLRRSAH